MIAEKSKLNDFTSNIQLVLKSEKEEDILLINALYVYLTEMSRIIKEHSQYEYEFARECRSNKD